MDEAQHGRVARKRRPPHPVIDGYRICLDCDCNLTIEEFPEYKHSKTGRRGVCRPCFAEFNRRRRQNRKPARPRNYQLERIRSAANRGECGPPTRQQHERMQKDMGLEPRRHPTEAQISRVAEQNARQAFQYLIKHKASDDWCERYFTALGQSWRNPRLTPGEKWRLRYRGG